MFSVWEGGEAVMSFKSGRDIRDHRKLKPKNYAALLIQIQSSNIIEEKISP